ncbi:hypothetical protein L6452_05912 [Arctium lappa]|uniref:Uncharacterized protein n=1 Tax=Arctium lappa TaxID=4217 RepID=A0ACB9EIS5_ARCLA|nr:hypothetical protein L6452_05912 [Arctium lappa]
MKLKKLRALDSLSESVQQREEPEGILFKEVAVEISDSASEETIFEGVKEKHSEAREKSSSSSSEESEAESES